ncbi:hypothetical protein F5B22DRAFT_650824 [Xylaria bambusicola]|uniref:uncharacterized protein n=1 Tax=Xylaria bambusicola TaxID=326684 RepID=UPI0020086098|nr:uncharacterized protein F5B22DRAFT_650824 [Xylaria bambusicola]KAI0506266.1 hypothetical protein F5B22DRAFT_650824 [Xylaria bambusicola]
MTHNLLFCTAEEAKPFVPKILASEQAQGIYPYALVESSQGFQPGQPYRDQLRKDDTFNTDFIGASINDCGAWALSKENNKYLYTDTIITVDALSVEDETVTLWVYPLHQDAPFLRRDQEPEIWYPFRVHYTKLWPLLVEFLDMGRPADTYGTLFMRNEEFTDANGVFDFDKANEIILTGNGG